jgi:putative endonuclease
MNSVPSRSFAAHWRRWRRIPPFARAKTGHLQLGAQGEKLAARFLRRHGYKILYRNFRGRRGGEIDLVCRDGETLVFVEVKTRTSEEFGRPLETISRRQRQRIILGGLAWLRLLDNPDIAFRFDVVEVVMAQGAPRLELTRDAFRLPDRYIY